MVTENRHLSLRKVATELSVPHESIRAILNDCLYIYIGCIKKSGAVKYIGRIAFSVKISSTLIF